MAPTNDTFENRMTSGDPQPKAYAKPVMRQAFAGWPMIIFWIAMFLFAGYASTHMVGAGDTWVALACGRHFVNHGVNTVEPFSANSHHAGPTDEDMTAYAKDLRDDIAAMSDESGTDHLKKSLKSAIVLPFANWVGSYPQWSQSSKDLLRYWHPTGWINQNWLTHVIFYKMVTIFGKPDAPGYDALVVWKFLMYILAVIVVYYAGRSLGVNPALAAVFACMAMFVGRSFLDIRPAGFSNLLVGVTVLILILSTYRNIRWIWLLVPIVVLWCNLHGGYLYAFIALTVFTSLHIFMALPKKAYRIAYFVAMLGTVIFTLRAMGTQLSNTESTPKEQSEWMFLYAVPFLILAVFSFIALWNQDKLVRIGGRGVRHCIGAGLVSFAGMIVLNPFHLTNLTHTYVISISEHAEQWRTVNEWHSAWEWANPVGESWQFLIMFVLGVMVLGLWTILWLTKPKSAVIKNARGKAAPAQLTNADEYVWPRVDFALIIIAVMTIYMAVQSRRFIPIAAMAACPVIALVIDQFIKMIAAKVTSVGRNRLALPEMPAWIKMNIIIAAATLTIMLGVWWGYNYYTIYLAPWPDDDEYNSVFMRMSASYAKPFCAGAFIRENHLAGNMYNYWTEGGFIAWIQDPNAKTGKTPLQLFMDGRAQAAYEPAKYDLWMNIMAGGPYANTASPDYVKVGNWLDEQLKKYKVWLVLMPSSQFDTPLMQGLERHPDWRTVFINNKQEILVDIKSPQGQDIMMKMIEGKAYYPDEFSKLYSSAHTLVSVNNDEAQRKGFEDAAAAFKIKPSQGPLIELFGAARNPQVRKEVFEIVQCYLGDFEKNKNEWARHDGFNDRVIAAIICANYLQKAGSDTDQQNRAAAMMDECRTLQREMMDASRW